MIREVFIMEGNVNTITNNCNFMDVKPAIVSLPYPPIQVCEKNQNYAGLLSIDYCGQTSEISAIMQYINHENRLSYEKCPLAKTILGIAMAEMIHLQKLGELICLLGGNLGFTVRQSDGKQKMWTPAYVKISENTVNMIGADIEGEKAAINQYRMHMRMIRDTHVNSVLARIIKDEEYHIMLLKTLMEEL